MHCLGAVAALVALIAIFFNLACYTARAFAMRNVADCDRDDSLGLLDTARAFALECLATLLVLLLIPVGWLMPGQRNGSGQRGPVVLIHGWGLNRGCWWWTRRRLLRDGWGPVHTFDYWSLSADIERAAANLATFLEPLARNSEGRPITLIGHSLGGLVIRLYARRYRAIGVRRLVTLGTPHSGTALAALPGKLRRRLAPDSALLNALAAGDRVPQQFDVIAIASLFDALVLPPTHARYPGAFNIQVRDIGHNQLLFSRRIYDLLKENLQAPPR